MGKTMAAVTLIFIGVVLAWMVLGSSVTHRTWSTDNRLRDEVTGLWGSPQMQLSPELAFRWRVKKTEREKVEDPTTQETKVVTRERWLWKEEPVILDRSELDVDLRMSQRRKGLLWYPTYEVGFRGEYVYTHDDDRDGTLVITYRFPSVQASYDDFRFEVDGRMDPKMTPVSEEGIKVVREKVAVRRGTTVPFKLAYTTRGLEWWRYSFGSDVNRVKNFNMSVTTDFHDIDFSDGAISPSHKQRTDRGWHLSWSFTNLISGFQIGLEMPRKINPGPLAAKISFFAPVSLAFFFVWMFVITLLKRVRLHPMNYLFLGAAFFSFHLLFSYTVDHIDVVLAFALSSAVSVFLVISYLRLVIGWRLAAVEAGISQLIYLVFFSYAHFLEGFTGLIVTVGSILTLFALMQLTGAVDWSRRMKGGSPSVRAESGVG